MSAVLVMPLLGADSARLRALGALMRQRRAEGTWPPPGPAQPPDPAQPTFTAIAEDHYHYSFPLLGITLDLSRLRRDRGDLTGLLAVHASCHLNGRKRILNRAGNFSVGSIQLRYAWIRSLEDRSEALGLKLGPLEQDPDWFGLLEDFCWRVQEADRDAGEPVIVDLRTVSPTTADDIVELEGLRVPLRHPSVFFADGGSAKSYYWLLLLGKLAERGERVALFDWEMDAAVHRQRLELLFGPQMPQIGYVRCLRPLVDEADRLAKFVRDNKITYLMYDSIAKACDGPPEAAEVAGRYQRAVRQIGAGSVHIAHITKNGEDQKPFGSVFWHNDARATWFARALPDLLDETVLHMAIYNRKVTQGALAPDIGFKITFGADRTSFAREEVDDGKLRKPTVRDYMLKALTKGPMSLAALAAEIGAKVDTVRRNVERNDKTFEKQPDGKIAIHPDIAWTFEVR